MTPDSEYYNDVLLVAESIYGGTWNSGAPPPEMVDFELMHPDGMGWSWPELQATPQYVRRYSWDLLQARRKAMNEQRSR